MTKHIFDCIDAHTCGNPVRLILSQKPDLAGTSMSQKRFDFIKNFDWIRKSLMFEPRGHDIMSGGMIFPPNDPNNDFSIYSIGNVPCILGYIQNTHRALHRLVVSIYNLSGMFIKLFIR